VIDHVLASSRSLGITVNPFMTRRATTLLIARFLSFFFSFSLDLYLFYFQVICLPHNLQIVHYVAGLVGSIHDSTAFASSRIAQELASFLLQMSGCGQILHMHVILGVSHHSRSL
jgi:hypothetical protein